MKEESGVRISEFLDGELTDKELARLSLDIQQTDNKSQFQRFARIGHVLRGESDVYSSIDVSEAVANAIENLGEDKTVSSAQSATSRQGLFSNWFKPVLGAAFASVIAVFTVLVNQTLTTEEGSQSLPAVAQQQVNKTHEIDLTQLASKNENKEMDIAVREELNNYLVNHSRSASGGNYQGMVPYVRAVAYEAGSNK